jgi:hypothetical protein
MKKETQSDRRNPSESDVFQLRNGDLALERHSGSWLISQGIRYLHAVDEQGILSYRRVVELLKARDDSAKVFAEVFAAADQHDVPLRWAILYLLADLEHPAAAEVFLKAAAEVLPKAPESSQGCTTVRDGEMLVGTMAINGLARVPAKDGTIEKALFTLLRKLEEPALRVEVVKNLLKLNSKHGEQIRELLPEEQRFMLYLRCADEKELTLEVDRQEVKERLALAPRLDQANIAPIASCDCKVE